MLIKSLMRRMLIKN